MNSNMISSVSIIPTILATTEEEYREKLKKIEDSLEFEGGWVQIDLMDNKFVQNKSVGFDVIANDPTSLKREAHLMVDYPENWIDELVKSGIERIVFPVEDTEGIEERISHVKNHGLAVGLSVNPETPLAKVKPFIDKIDLLLILSVHPGFGGQEFIPETLEKVKEAAKLQVGADFVIEVDGGINESNVKEVVGAGANNVVIGAHLINGNITENLESIWQAINY